MDLYRFGACELDVARRELRRAGRVVAIEPKVFQVLQHLLANADAVVAKDQLLEAVWRGTRVNEIAIARCISAARLAIGDRRGPQALIRTVHGVGYRFAGPVVRMGGDDPAAAPAVQGGGRDGAVVSVSGERKQVSVLCAALPALGDRDLDERHALMLRVEAIAQAAIRGFGGTILALSERGVVAAFGAPAASEHHAADAFMAARQLIAGWPLKEEAAAEPHGPAIGIDSGPCVVERRPPPLTLAIVGDAVAGAEALSRRAIPGEIVASPRTALLLGRVRRAAADAKPPLRIAGEGDDPVASPVTRAPGEARFVGRVAELSTLDAELQAARRAGGRIVCVTGEPGIGKSRLVREFLASLPPTHVNLVAGHCQSFGRTTPLLPLRALLLDLIGGGETTDAAALGRALDRQLARLGIDHAPFRTALRHILGIDRIDEALLALGPAAVRARSFAALHEVVGRLARQRPTVLLIEDLHWIDATSDAYLAALVERLRGLRLLVVVTHRPGAEPEWTSRQGATRITLGPLPPHDAVRLVRAIWSDRLRTLSLADALVARSGGNPFFLEELTQVAMHEGGRAEVPQNVEAVIAARIDQLQPRAKQVLQAAAVLGTEVARALLQPLVGAHEDEFDAALADLAAADFLRASPGAAEPTLAFKHVLTREVAYGSLLARERRRLHGLVAAMLRERFPELAAARPELRAQHAAAAALHAEAAEAWTRAADSAVARSAYTEALSHVRLGLDLVESIVEKDRRLRVELRLRLLLGQVLWILRGFTDDESADALEAARSLCRRVDDPIETGRVLRALWPVYFARARYDAVLEIGAALERSGARAGQLTMVSSAQAALGATRFFLGDLADAARLLADGVRNGLEAQRADPDAPRGMDFVVFGESYLARVNWLLGAPGAALEGCARAVAAAEAAANPWLRVQALYFTGLVHQYRRDAAAAAGCATQLLAVAEESEFRYWILLGQLLRGWCRERAGEAGGIAEIQTAIAGLERMGTVIGRPYFLVHLAELQLARREVAAARASLDRAVAVSKETGERVWEAEQHRLLGDILVAEARDAGGRTAARLRGGAAKAYATAHEVATRQGACALALRALLATHALDPGGSAGRRAAARIATLLARIEGDRQSVDLAAADRIAGTRRKSAGNRTSPGSRR